MKITNSIKDLILDKQTSFRQTNPKSGSVMVGLTDDELADMARISKRELQRIKSKKDFGPFGIQIILRVLHSLGINPAEINLYPIEIDINREPTLEINIDDKLSNINFENNTVHLSIRNPVLLLESLSGRNKNFLISNERIIKPTINDFDNYRDKDIILKCLGDNTKINYGEVSVRWLQQYSPWPPSIDALLFGKNLIHSKIIGNIFKGQNPVICDIGTGTGFLAAVCAKHLHPTELIITDTRKSAVELAMHNVKSNSSPDCKLIDLVGFGLTPILAHIKSKVDAILLTPPYIPIYNKSLNHRSEVYSNVLLEQVLLDFHHLSKHLILLISSVANAEYQEAISRSSSRLSIIEIDYKWVPFRVSPATRSNYPQRQI